MPTIPNFLANQQTPLGAAFANLARTLASGPSEADKYKSADEAVMTHRKMLGLQGLGEQLMGAFKPGVPAPVGTGAPQVSPIAPGAPAFVPQANGQTQPSPIAAVMQRLAPTAAPSPASVTQGPGMEGPAGPSPITAAFANTAPEAPAAAPKPAVDYGEFTRNAMFGGVKPEDAGGYLMLGNANTYGARDARTTNSAAGIGKYDGTAEHFDIGQANELTKAQNTNLKDRQNNADTIAGENARNAANIQKDYGVEGMKERHDDAQGAAASGLTPAGLDYTADIYRRTGQLPALGMGKSAAATRTAILNRAQELDRQDGRTGADAVAQFADYQGERSGQRTAGTREAQAGMAVNELSNLIPVAKHAFANVARTGFVPADQLLNAYQNGTNDPDLNQAAVAVNDVVNAHARAINPNGQVTDAGRAQGYQLLNTAKDQIAFNAILDQMAVGAAAALKSPGQTRAQMHSAASAPLAPHNAPTPGGDIDALVNHYKTKTP